MNVARRGFLEFATGVASFLGMGREVQGQLLTKTIGGASVIGNVNRSSVEEVCETDSSDDCEDPSEVKRSPEERSLIEKKLKEALRDTHYVNILKEKERLEFKIARRKASRIQGLDADLYMLQSMSLIRRIQIQQERDMDDHFQLEKLDKAEGSIRNRIVKAVTGGSWFSSSIFARRKTTYSKATALLRRG